MALITLTTDWKTSDFYVGAVKGAIVSLCPNAQVIDLNHQISTFNISQAAFVVRNSFSYFPKGTVHLIDVNSESTQSYPHIAISYHGHYFLGADNGVFGLLCREEPDAAVKIDKPMDNECLSFPALHVFAPVAAFLAMGHPINDLGEAGYKINPQTLIRATYDEAVITGNVIYIDSYQNAITNVSKELFEKVGKGRKFEILIQSNRYRITRINRKYNETSEGELLALFNSAGLLEIAICMGNVAELINLSLNSVVRIKFFN
jgi:S-adenosylmethionine hydrolase